MKGQELSITISILVALIWFLISVILTDFTPSFVYDLPIKEQIKYERMIFP